MLITELCDMVKKSRVINYNQNIFNMVILQITMEQCPV